MNIARWFSYTRLLERELARARLALRHERSQWETERIRLEEERQRIENSAFLAQGLTPPHRHLLTSPSAGNSNKPRIPRAVGPFGVAARNAQFEADQERRIDETVRAPVLPAEDAERITKAAEEKGLLATDGQSAAA
jgi:hypothetical protein